MISLLFSGFQVWKVDTFFSLQVSVMVLNADGLKPASSFSFQDSVASVHNLNNESFPFK